MSNEADLKAIDDLFRRTAPVTPEATALRQSWLTWFPTLGWWDLNYSKDVFDEAKTRRNKFNLANATTQAQKDAVVRVFTQSYDVKGPVLPTGEVGTQIKKPTPAPVMQGSHPVIKQGSKGPAVAEWQRIIGVKVDSNFGPGTHSATVGWQKTHKDVDGKPLTPDGVVGQKTWQAALGTAKAADAPPVKQEESLLSALNPFSSKPAPASPVATAAKPKPAAKSPATSTAKPAPTPTPATGAATSTPSAVASSGDKAGKTSTLQVAQAGMLGGLDKLPLWAKVAAFVGAAGVFFFGRNAKVVNYNTTSKRRRRAA
jgi:hypothetical protein